MPTLLTDTTLARVHSILVDQLGIAPEQIQPDGLIMADLGADSLDMMEIAMRAEEVFNLTLSDEEMERIQTVNDLYEALARHGVDR